MRRGTPDRRTFHVKRFAAVAPAASRALQGGRVNAGDFARRPHCRTPFMAPRPDTLGAARRPAPVRLEAEGGQTDLGPKPEAAKPALSPRPEAEALKPAP